MTSDFTALLEQVRACTHCQAMLPHEPRPVVQASSTAKILIASQAPGSRVHASGVPFDDASGNQLRKWAGLTIEQFYDERQVAIVPMAFCYPGRGTSGDVPPRSECAPLWRERLLGGMKEVALTLLVGGYAQKHVLGAGRVTDRVRDFRHYLPRYFPLPHPSWRSRIWMRKNPWFERDVLPELRRQICHALN